VVVTAWLTVDGLIADVLPKSKRSIHELTRRGLIPHSRIPGTRACLFDPAEIRAWLDGAPLEVIELPGGGRRVRPMTNGGA
jgi:hypothetical protein